MFGGGTPAPTFGATTSGIGGAAPSGGLFSTGGSTTTFGMKPPGTTAFGSPSTTTPFGATTGGGFGTTTPTTAFGQPSTTTTTPFGASTGSAFGTPQTGLGGLGTGTAFGVGATGATGTGNPPYKPIKNQEGTNANTIVAITAMNEYQNKSFEELRFEDYQKGNNKGVPQQGGMLATGTTGFGATQSPGLGGGGFMAGGTTTTGFGATTTGFGNTTPNLLGAPKTSGEYL